MSEDRMNSSPTREECERTKHIHCSKWRPCGPNSPYYNEFHAAPPDETGQTGPDQREREAREFVRDLDIPDEHKRVITWRVAAALHEREAQVEALQRKLDEERLTRIFTPTDNEEH